MINYILIIYIYIIHILYSRKTSMHVFVRMFYSRAFVAGARRHVMDFPKNGGQAVLVDR